MAKAPDKILDLLTSKVTFAHLATLQPDGSPQVTPVWFDYTDGKIRICSAKGRIKDRNLRKDGRVALSISDPENPYRYVQIRGKVEKLTEEGASEHIEALSHKYLGKPYPYRQPGEVRVTYVIEPESFQTN